jgi:dihydroflavonol-4-reductase
LLRPTSRTGRIDDLDYEPHLGDVRDLTSLNAGMKGCAGVIHLAGISNWNDIQSPLLNQVIVNGTKNILQAARMCGIKRLVFVSSIVTLSGTSDPDILLNEESKFTLQGKKELAYSQVKYQAEILCKQATTAGLPVVTVNPAEVYGPGDYDLITAGNLLDFTRSNPVFVPHGGTSIVHVDDVAQGILTAFERGTPGERYILGGDNLSVYRLAALTLEMLGQRKNIISVPNHLLTALVWLGQNFHIPLPFNSVVIPYATRYWFVDNSKARKVLGIHFRSAEETLGSTLTWLCKKNHIRQFQKNNDSQ